MNQLITTIKKEIKSVCPELKSTSSGSDRGGSSTVYKHSPYTTKEMVEIIKTHFKSKFRTHERISQGRDGKIVEHYYDVTHNGKLVGVCSIKYNELLPTVKGYIFIDRIQCDETTYEQYTRHLKKDVLSYTVI